MLLPLLLLRLMRLISIVVVSFLHVVFGGAAALVLGQVHPGTLLVVLTGLAHLALSQVWCRAFNVPDSAAAGGFPWSEMIDGYIPSSLMVLDV